MDANEFNQKQLDDGTLTMTHVSTLTTAWQKDHPPLDVDGKAGTNTIISLDATVVPPEEKDWGQHSLSVAISILNWGETIANNKGPQITIIRGGRILKWWQKGAWCADTTSFESLEGYANFFGYLNWVSCPADLKAQCLIKRTPSASGFMHNVAKVGHKVPSHLVRPGDFVLFKYPKNHHTAIVAEVNGNRFRTIDGNRGRWNRVTQEGSVVGYFNHEFGQPDIRFFARLPVLER